MIEVGNDPEALVQLKAYTGFAAYLLCIWFVSWMLMKSALLFMSREKEKRE